MCEEQGGELKPIRPYREPFSIDKEEGQVHTQLYCGTGYKYKCMHKDIGRGPCCGFCICILTYIQSVGLGDHILKRVCCTASFITT